MSSYNDWNSLYENEWPNPNTYSKKWHWEMRLYRNVSLASLPKKTQNSLAAISYERAGPADYSEMYKRAYPTSVYYDAYVNNLGDL